MTVERPVIVQTPIGPFLRGAPEGFCPWAEQRCDEHCQPYEGCKLWRAQPFVKAEPLEPQLGQAGA